MDLLDFEAKDLYFDRPDAPEVERLIKQAAEDYSSEAELPLLRAYFLAPESMNVLVALNRFYYYQHRLEDALSATGKALDVVRPAIGFPEDWRDLQPRHIEEVPPDLLTRVRLYLFALKAIGFLNMRLHRLDVSQSIFEKLVELDRMDRIGAKGLLELLQQCRAEVGEAATTVQ
jgi:tetratricopeptide (TPR) repeat protein